MVIANRSSWPSLLCAVPDLLCVLPKPWHGPEAEAVRYGNKWGPDGKPTSWGRTRLTLSTITSPTAVLLIRRSSPLSRLWYLGTLTYAAVQKLQSRLKGIRGRYTPQCPVRVATWPPVRLSMHADPANIAISVARNLFVVMLMTGVGFRRSGSLMAPLGYTSLLIAMLGFALSWLHIFVGLGGAQCQDGAGDGDRRDIPTGPRQLSVHASPDHARLAPGHRQGHPHPRHDRRLRPLAVARFTRLE